MLFAYVGNWTDDPFEPDGTVPETPGVYAFAVDEATAELEFVEMRPQDDPSYLAVTTSGVLYGASHSVTTTRGEPGSSVIAYRLDSTTGGMTPYDSIDLPIVDLAHACLHPSERYLMLTCTKGGGIVLCPLDESGRFEGTPHVLVDGRARVPFPPDDATKVNADYDERRRLGVTSPHCIGTDRTGRTVLVADRDRDCLAVYRIDPDTQQFVRGEPPTAGTAPNAGPRHWVVHPGNRTVYVANELDNTVSTFTFDPESARLELVDATPTLEPGFTGYNIPGGIKVLRSGRFLYVTNRGHESIASYAIDPGTERLTFLGTTPVDGKGPWAVTLTPDERFLFAANKVSHSVESFLIDPDSGALTPTGHRAAVRGATKVVFWQSAP